jgi:hypothetical protein
MQVILLDHRVYKEFKEVLEQQVLSDLQVMV